MCIVRSFFVGVLLPWLLMASSVVYAQAPTDEELKELERQIEQQEAEQAAAKRKVAEEAKLQEQEAARRKAEEEAKKIELGKQHAEEETARRNAEEDAKERAEEETKLKAEAEKKEKYSSLITEAEHAINNKDRELALNKYTEALKLYPDAAAANSGIKEAEKLMDKVCYEILGDWIYELGLFRFTMNVREDGTVTGSADGTWECIDPAKRQFKFNVSALGVRAEKISELNKDGTCLTDDVNTAEIICWRRRGFKREDDQTKDPPIKQAPF